MFRLNKGRLVTNNQCSNFLGIALCHIYLPAPVLEGWSYNELNSDCFVTDENKGNPFHDF